MWMEQKVTNYLQIDQLLTNLNSELRPHENISPHWLCVKARRRCVIGPRSARFSLKQQRDENLLRVRHLLEFEQKRQELCLVRNPRDGGCQTGSAAAAPDRGLQPRNGAGGGEIFFITIN